MLSRQLMIYFLLCIMAIVMVREFSVSPQSFSGNPVILIFPFVVLTFGLFGYELFLKLKEASFEISTWRNIVVCSCIVLVAASVSEIVYYSELIRELGGSPSTKGSRIFSLPWLNQYTNTIFVNFYTFLIYTSFLMFCTSLYRWIKK
ncbi:hypothetical protein [Neobacillus sp. DY30]|uniref:hypothetical protein n=1 Tax=Neobacillus sp. DY30 TaxID=3047871 RepID=UPI0024BFCA15|nr:hypothetical protein [Neobacillus sp. DY30]WHY01462.1 hypothetical protein QNH29_04205 [Neobacillus sp. DY30]